MTNNSPIWRANLDHLQIDSPDPLALAEWYRDVMGMTPERLSDDLYIVQAPQRRLLIGRGQKTGHPFNAWTMERTSQLHAFRAHAEKAALKVEASPTPLFGPDAFAVRDPDGRLAVFGLPARDVPGTQAGSGKAAALPARLQHAVVATPQLERMREFYEQKLGFIVSDTVYTNQEHEPLGNPHVHFFRADNEHHSLAVFTGSTARYDHHCYETKDSLKKVHAD
jgi:catechol 2,3-dioxygenase-like lactoylglutathione lyase family enzyme